MSYLDHIIPESRIAHTHICRIRIMLFPRHLTSIRYYTHTNESGHHSLHEACLHQWSYTSFYLESGRVFNADRAFFRAARSPNFAHDYQLTPVDLDTNLVRLLALSGCIALIHIAQKQRTSEAALRVAEPDAA